MAYVFYLVILIAFVYVIHGIVHSTVFSATEIPRSELPPVIEKEFQQLFPNFTTQVVRKQKAWQRYQLEGKYAGRPGTLVFALTPDSEISKLDFSQAGRQEQFQKLDSLSNAQVPPRIARMLQPFIARDQIHFESGKVELGLLGSDLGYRIQVNSTDYHYQFEVSESGELIAFSRRGAA